MHFPAELRYTREHEWIRLESDGTAVVGITDFAQSELGDIVFVELQAVGTALEQNAVFGTVEAVKTVSELYLPVAGEILEHNEAVLRDPSLLNRDPYGAGWLVRIRPRDVAQLELLLDAEAYKAMIGVS
ncbi:MAG: glycine cleavage system protein GcvH [Bacteroidetes bacterium]|nr:glycine cleavage system protein GcvH [Rhodothermia bacterium]MCS7154841.1 glycine cleavage system protein GcvH [Bacteroidota bacterium]MCX7907001.1 glycine cleavage system protein GcvH [Bacteroidota bacterium]MDW8137635.1 glycine cleavage system protein GcvH [Bacteroidota bacterium]MDW8285411.1 glycine cleavage system protein GcvH [Bacteroidota bacterium]